MKVIDLIIKLQQLPPNLDVMIDYTNDKMQMFKLVETNYVAEVTTATNETVVLISPFEYENDEDELD